MISTSNSLGNNDLGPVTHASRTTLGQGDRRKIETFGPLRSPYLISSGAAGRFWDGSFLRIMGLSIKWGHVIVNRFRGADRTLTLTIYYDFICPYCRLARFLVQDLGQFQRIHVDWRGYPIAPDIPEAGVPWRLVPGELAQFQETVVRRSSEFGAQVRIPRMRANSIYALKAAEYAKNTQYFNVFQEKVFDAYWMEGQNIGDADVVLGLAADAGLNTNILKNQLNERKLSQILDDNRRAVPYVAIPTFVAGKYRVYGLEDLQRIRQFLELALDAEQRPPATSPANGHSRTKPA